jgi:hypothetical protein
MQAAAQNIKVVRLGSFPPTNHQIDLRIQPLQHTEVLIRAENHTDWVNLILFKFAIGQLTVFLVLQQIADKRAGDRIPRLYLHPALLDESQQSSDMARELHRRDSTDLILKLLSSVDVVFNALT